MKKSALLIVLSLMLGFTFASTNTPVVKETTKGKMIEVELLSQGNISLFSNDSQVIPSTVPQDPMEEYAVTYTTYFISKGENDLVELSCANYKSVLRDQMKDKPVVAEKIGQKGYKFSDLESIIQGYNKI